MLRFFVCATLLLLTGGCGSDAESPAAGDAPRGRGGWGGGAGGAVLVTTQAVQRRNLAEVVEAIGTTLANESVTISAKVTETISDIEFEDGQLVEAGQVLVQLTNIEESSLLDEAEANLQDARTQFVRLEDLLKQRSVPVSDVDEARSRYSAANARYQAVVARLDDRLIRAPFSGLLGFRSVSAGTLVTPGTEITTLDDVSVIKLDFSIPETYLGAVQPGLALTAFTPAYPNQAFEASITTIGSRVDPVTRAAMVRAHIRNDELLLRPGMLMSVKLETANRSVLMIPETALVQRAADVFVYVLGEDLRVATRPVQHGVRRDRWVEIVAGLSEGEVVVSEGVIKLRPGMTVRTTSSGAAVAGAPDAVAGEGRRDNRSGGGPPTERRPAARSGK